MRIAGKLLKLILLFAVTFMSVFPFYLLIMMTTYSTEEIFKGILLTPGSYLKNNIALVFVPGFFKAYANSLMVSALSVALSLLSCSMAAYALTVYQFKLKKAVFNFVLLTMMIPNQISLVGYMNEMRALGINKTLLPLVLIWIGYGFGVFWMTQYMRASLPVQIIESARIDGSNELSTFFRIVLPCVTPALGTLALMVFLWSWNQYMLPLVLVSRADNYTIPIYISSLGNAFRTDYAARMTGLLFSTLPLLTIFIFGSKYFIKGLTAGAVKG